MLLTSILDQMKEIKLGLKGYKYLDELSFPFDGVKVETGIILDLSIFN